MWSIKQKLWLLVFAFAFSQITMAQQTPSYRWEPGFSIKNKLTEKWTTTLQLKGRGQANSYGEQDLSTSLLMVDIRGYLSYTLFNESTLQIGYIIRRNNPLEEVTGTERRLIQQYSFFSSFDKHRIGQSFTLEERMINKNFVGRLRYALSDDFPLQGVTLDRGEYFFYSKLQALFSFDAHSTGLENRLNIGIGRLFYNSQKLSFDVEARYSGLLLASQQLIIQFNTVYYLNL